MVADMGDIRYYMQFSVLIHPFDKDGKQLTENIK